RRFQEWTASKVFQKLWVRLLKVYDDLKGVRWTWQSLDSISVKAPLGGILQVQILQTEANWEQIVMYLRIKKVFHYLLVSQVATMAISKDHKFVKTQSTIKTISVINFPFSCTQGLLVLVECQQRNCQGFLLQ